MTTKFEGKWRYKLVKEPQDYVEYEFKGNDLKIIHSKFGIETYATFTFDEEKINFEIFTEAKNWTQNYRLTDTYLDLQVEETHQYFSGRFFKVIE